jgi:hypothetical protein
VPALQLPGQGFARRLFRVVADHRGPIFFGGMAFGGGCVVRHDDDRADAQHPADQGHRLGVVARGVGDHAGGPLGIRQLTRWHCKRHGT